MLQCTKILVPNNDQNDFRMIESSIPAAEERRLEKLIPDFFACGKYGIRIAVACGSDRVWSAEEFAQVLKQCAVNGRKDSIHSWKTGGENTVCVANIYATTDDKTGSDLDGVMGAFHGSLMDIFKGLLDKATDTISESNYKIQTACTQLNNLRMVPSLRSTTDMFAKDISASLSSDNVLSGFPTVMILIFLPEFAFDAFLDQKSFFFKQIEYVLLFESEDRRKRKEAELRAFRLSQELEAVRSELEDTKRQLLAEKSEPKRRELEALVAEKERKIAELQAALLDAKQENDLLKSSLVAEQNKNAELEGRLASEVNKNKALETVLTRVFCYELDLRPVILNENWDSNETEIEEKIKSNPGYGKFVGVRTNKEAVRDFAASDNKTNPSIQDSDLADQLTIVDPGDVVQVVQSPNKTTDTVGFIEKDDRQSRKEDGRER